MVDPHFPIGSFRSVGDAGSGFGSEGHSLMRMQTLPHGARSTWSAGHQVPADLVRRHRRSLASLLVIGGLASQRRLAAQAFHAESPVRCGPFVTLDCEKDAAVLKSALRSWISSVDTGTESQLLSAIERGTLYLEGVGSLERELQRLLLTFARRRQDHPTSLRPDRWAGRLAAGDGWWMLNSIECGRFSIELFDCLDKIRVELDPALAA